MPFVLSWTFISLANHNHFNYKTKRVQVQVQVQVNEGLKVDPNPSSFLPLFSLLCSSQFYSLCRFQWLCLVLLGSLLLSLFFLFVFVFGLGLGFGFGLG
jgi:hypothetical protein